MPPVRIAIVNDYPLVIAGVHELLRRYADRVAVAELDANREVLSRVDVALFDGFGAPVLASEDIRCLVNRLGVGAVLLYTWDCTPQVLQNARQAGVNGVVSKRIGAEQLVEAIEAVHHGDGFVIRDDSLEPMLVDEQDPTRREEWLESLNGLTMREAEVVALICQGFSNVDIADRLYLSPNSVKSYIRTAYKKMGVETRSQAVAWGIQHDLLPGVMRRELI